MTETSADSLDSAIATPGTTSVPGRIADEISRGLLEALPDAVVVVGPDGRIVFVNAETSRLLGYDPGELVGRPVEVLVPESVAGHHQAFRERYLARPASRRMGPAMGLHAVRKDGSLAPVDIALSPLRSSIGQLTLCVVRDASEHAAMTETLRATEQSFRTLVDQATDGIFLSDASGQYLAVNDAACAIFGYSREELLRMRILDLIAPGEAERLPNELARLGSGAPVKSDWHFRRRDGSTFEGEVNARMLPDTRLLAVLRDVTERKRNEETQYQARRFIEAVAKASPSWIYVFDLDDESIRYLNRSILRDLGYSADAERLTRLADFRAFLPSDDQDRVTEMLAAWRNLADDEVRSSEYRIRHADGTVRWCLGRETVFSRHPDGRVHQVLGTLDDITDRKRSHEALRRSEQRWQFALEGAGDGVWDWDPQTGAAFYGPRWQEMLGFADGEIGTTRHEWSSRVHPDDLAAATAAIDAHLRGETSHFSNEQRMRCRDGRWIWVLDRGKVVERDARGVAVRVVGTLTDITPLKLAMERLRESEERFRTMIEDLDVGVLLQDAATDSILLSNRAAEEMLGLAATELDRLSSHNWPWRLVREDGTEYSRDELPSVVAARSGRPVRHQIVGSCNTATGECRWLQVTAMPRHELGEVVRHVLVTMTDVTSRKTAEAALIAAREEWEQSFNALTDWVSVLDRDGRITLANRAMRERFEQQPGSLVGTHHLTIYEGEASADSDPCASVLAGGPPVEYTTTMLHVPGRFLISCYPLTGTGPGAAVHVVRDITKQWLLEEQLRQSQKMHAIGQLAGGVAHDFNNLLTVISSCTELALQDLPPDTGTVRDDIASIRDAADRAAVLTRQLLLFGRKGFWEEKSVNLNEVVQHAGQMLRRLIGEDVVMATKLSPRLWATRGDPAQLEQALLNLALNARDAMPNGGLLSIDTSNQTFDENDCRVDPARRPGRFVQLRVSDTGTGMSPEVRTHLFEPFFTTKGPGKGTGLGLSTVYGIVQQAGGFVTVESEVGVGTTFTVCLPAAADGAGTVDAMTDLARGASGTERVLVVEDDDNVRHVLVRSLQSHGFDVVEVASAIDALDRLARDTDEAIALLITDVVMPGIGGRELADRARALRPTLPVLFISGYSPETFTRERPLIPGDQLLQKPFTPQALTVKVRQMLDARARA